MWDPFTKICRKLYCGRGLVLEHDECVKSEESDEDEGIDKYIIVHTHRYLSFNFSFDCEDKLSFDLKNMSSLVAEAVAEMFHISRERIRNVDVQLVKDYQPEEDEDTLFKRYYFTASLQIDNPEMYHKKELSAEGIASTMAWTVSKDAWIIELGTNYGRVSSFKESTPFNDTSLSEWCIGGNKIEYWNQDFTIINENGTSMELTIDNIYVNKTGKHYERGFFLASILYRGNNQSTKAEKISGAVLVCDGLPKIKSACMRTLLNVTEYEILPNATIRYLGDLTAGSVLDLDNVEISATGSVYACYKPSASLVRNSTGTFGLSKAIVEGEISTVLTSISVVALSMTLLTYGAFPKLRNLPGCTVMNLTFSIFMYQVCFLLGQRHPRETLCWILSVVMHFSILSTLSWMNVMAYDLFRTFGHKHILTHLRSKSAHLLWYFSFAYGVPMSVVSVAIMAEHFSSMGALDPGYGAHGVCWINNHVAALAFFGVPLLLVITINVLLFAITIASIRSVSKKIRANVHRVRGLSYWLLYVRMSSVVGFTWIFALIAAFVTFPTVLSDISVYCFITFNALQGVFTFFAFVFNRNVLKLWTQSSVGRFLKRCKKGFLDRTTNSTKWNVGRKRDIYRVSSTSTVASLVSYTNKESA